MFGLGFPSLVLITKPVVVSASDFKVLHRLISHLGLGCGV